MDNYQQQLHETSERIKALIALRDQQQQLIHDLTSQQQQLSLFLDTPQTTIDYSKTKPRRVTVAPPQGEKYSPSSKATKILSLIAQGYTTTKALAEKTQLSLTTVQMVTRDLRARGYIRNNGSQRNEKKIVRQIPAHTIEIPCKPYVVYALTEKGQSRIAQTPQKPLPNNTPTPQTRLIRDKVEAQRDGLRPRAQEMLNLIKGGTTRATQLSKTMGISFESVSTELYILQRLGHIKLRGDYATRANAINRMSRHLVDRIAKPV